MILLINYFLEHIWRPVFCKNYLESTFKLSKTEYCILQKLIEYLEVTDNNIIWFNYTYNSIYDEYGVIYEYIDPIYKIKVKGHCILNGRIFNRIFEN